MTLSLSFFFFFFFNDTATTEIYTLSLHDALPISRVVHDERFPVSAPLQLVLLAGADALIAGGIDGKQHPHVPADRKSTRLNSSHSQISYAVFCLKKKKKTTDIEYVLVSVECLDIA